MLLYALRKIPGDNTTNRPPTVFPQSLLADSENLMQHEQTEHEAWLCVFSLLLVRVKSHMSSRDAKEVDSPQLLGMVPDRVLLYTARVAKLSKQSVEPQLDGKDPFSSLPWR